MKDRYRNLERETYDAVVVGAGAGGLTAAALLARHGRSVLVLDQHYVAGGNATIFRRRGYEFDVGLHYIGDCGPDGLIPRILRAAGATGVRFLEMDPDGFDTYHFPDFVFRVPRSVGEFRRRLLVRFPGEARGIDRYLRLLREAWSLTQIAGPMSALRTLPRALLALRWRSRTLGAFLDTCTADVRLRAVLTGQLATYAQPPSRRRSSPTRSWRDTTSTAPTIRACRSRPVCSRGPARRRRSRCAPTTTPSAGRPSRSCPA